MSMPLLYIPYVSDKGRERLYYETLQSKARSHAARFRIPKNSCAGSPTAEKYRSSSWRYRIFLKCTTHAESVGRDSIGQLSTDDIRSSASRTGSGGGAVTNDGSIEVDTLRGAVSEEERERLEDEPKAPILWSWMSGARPKSFDYMVGIDRDGVALDIDFFVHYITPTVAPISEAFNIVNVYGRWLLEDMAKYDELFHILLGLIKAGRTAMTCPGSPVPREAILLAGQAMSKLRDKLGRLDAQVDDGVILTMMCLAMFERSLGNDGAFQTHSAQIEQIIASCGGVNRLSVSSSARATLTVYLFLSGNQLPTTTSGSRHYQEKSGLERPDPPFYDMLFLEKLPSGFRNLARTGVLSPEILQVIYRINNIRDWSPRDSGNRHSKDEEKSEVDRAGDFWDAFTVLGAPNRCNAPSFEKLICLALFRYCANRVHRFRLRLCIYHSATTQLTAQLPSFTLPVSRTQRDCLIWAWLMAIDSWTMSQDCTKLSMEGAQLLSDMRKALPELRDWSWWDLEALGQNFFWGENLSVLLEANWMSSTEQKS